MNYKELLEHSYQVERQDDNCPPKSRLQFLSRNVFDFTTYADDLDEILANKAMRVCSSIHNKTTFEFIKDDADHETYITMVNMPFFQGRLDWGCSIRGAWWSHEQPNLSSYGLWQADEQICDLKFNKGDWIRFMVALLDFSIEEMK